MVLHAQIHLLWSNCMSIARTLLHAMQHLLFLALVQLFILPIHLAHPILLFLAIGALAILLFRLVPGVCDLDEARGQLVDP